VNYHPLSNYTIGCIDLTTVGQSQFPFDIYACIFCSSKPSLWNSLPLSMYHFLHWHGEVHRWYCDPQGCTSCTSSQASRSCLYFGSH